MDAREIEHLYDRYGHVVYGRCLRLLGSSADAEEALQEVFLRAMKNAKGFRHEASPFANVATSQTISRASMLCTNFWYRKIFPELAVFKP